MVKERILNSMSVLVYSSVFVFGLCCSFAGVVSYAAGDAATETTTATTTEISKDDIFGRSDPYNKRYAGSNNNGGMLYTITRTGETSTFDTVWQNSIDANSSPAPSFMSDGMGTTVNFPTAPTAKSRVQQIFMADQSEKNTAKYFGAFVNSGTRGESYALTKTFKPSDDKFFSGEERGKAHNNVIVPVSTLMHLLATFVGTRKEASETVGTGLFSGKPGVSIEHLANNILSAYIGLPATRRAISASLFNYSGRNTDFVVSHRDMDEMSGTVMYAGDDDDMGYEDGDGDWLLNPRRLDTLSIDDDYDSGYDDDGSEDDDYFDDEEGDSSGIRIIGAGFTVGYRYVTPFGFLYPLQNAGSFLVNGQSVALVGYTAFAFDGLPWANLSVGTSIVGAANVVPVAGVGTTAATGKDVATYAFYKDIVSQQSGSSGVVLPSAAFSGRASVLHGVVTIDVSMEAAAGLGVTYTSRPVIAGVDGIDTATVRYSQYFLYSGKRFSSVSDQIVAATLEEEDTTVPNIVYLKAAKVKSAYASKLAAAVGADKLLARADSYDVYYGLHKTAGGCTASDNWYIAEAGKGATTDAAAVAALNTAVTATDSDKFAPAVGAQTVDVTPDKRNFVYRKDLCVPVTDMIRRSAYSRTPDLHTGVRMGTRVAMDLDYLHPAFHGVKLVVWGVVSTFWGIYAPLDEFASLKYNYGSMTPFVKSADEAKKQLMAVGSYRTLGRSVVTSVNGLVGAALKGDIQGDGGERVVITGGFRGVANTSLGYELEVAGYPLTSTGTEPVGGTPIIIKVRPVVDLGGTGFIRLTGYDARGNFKGDFLGLFRFGTNAAIGASVNFGYHR